jgi:alkylation response protein AidB-like acyl-CoA dehydrogenase
MTDLAQPTSTEEHHVLDLCEQVLHDHDPKGDRTEFLGAQYDAGLAWVHFDEGSGGLGLSPKLQATIFRKMAAHGAPNPAFINVIGYGMCAPTVFTHGTDEQRERYLRPLFTCEEIWCQLFSEPGAGSDVAGLSSRAVRDGDEWVVNGQKVWTTLAHVSKWGCLITRTDPEAPKHKGLTYFVVDMKQPGVEVRPLRQMTGDAEFNEVYFTDARIPDSERLGDVGDGWRVALTTLMNERVAIGGGAAPRGSGAIADAVAAWRAMPSDRQDPATRDELMRLWSKAEVARLTNMRASQNRAMGTPGPEGSTGKLAFAENNKEIYAFVMQLLGADGMLYGKYQIERSAVAMGDAPLQQKFLRSRANSIEGGTSEVMRNILGERVLGLPGDVRTDKDLPWSEVPRN